MLESRGREVAGAKSSTREGPRALFLLWAVDDQRDEGFVATGETYDRVRNRARNLKRIQLPNDGRIMLPKTP